MIKQLLIGLGISVAACGITAATANAEETGNAEEMVYLLVVKHTNGSEIKVPFSENPELTYVGGVLKLTSSEKEMEYASGEFAEMAIEKGKVEDPKGPEDPEDPKDPDDPGSVKGVNNSVSAPHINGDQISFSGLTAGSVVSVIDMSGAELGRAIADSEGNASLDMRSNEKGAYVIKTENSTFKLLKK